jgi:hypothetical protein
MKTITTLASFALAVATANSTLRADTFGTTGNQFSIDFVTVGNAGNTYDAGAGGGIYSEPYGGVSYIYRVGTYEVSQDAITTATASGLLNVTAGAWTGNQPAADISWYETAAFVNFLNTSTGHQAAYDLTFSGSWSMNLWSSAQAWQTGGENLYRHKDAYYFLPSEDEWYKAAYHKNDGVTTNYWDYPTGSNSPPDGIDSPGDPAYEAVLNDGFNQGHPNAVASAGSASSAYGTYGQGGNVWEWTESASNGLNNSSVDDRAYRAGDWSDTEEKLRASYRHDSVPTVSSDVIGFRVASVPEPTTALLLLSSAVLFVLRRRRQTQNDRDG